MNANFASHLPINSGRRVSHTIAHRRILSVFLVSALLLASTNSAAGATQTWTNTTAGNFIWSTGETS